MQSYTQVYLKEIIRKYISQTNYPMRLWDYCAERRARIHNVTPRNPFQLNDNNHLTAKFFIQGRICQYGWYEW